MLQNNISEKHGLLHPIVDIFIADDIVFAQIVAGLHLDDFQIFLARVFQAMDIGDRDVGAFILCEDDFLVAIGHLGGAMHDHPMF